MKGIQYKVDLCDKVNNIEIMLSDKQDIISDNIKRYIINQDDKTITIIANKNDKALRVEHTNRYKLNAYFGKLFLKDYVELIIYDEKEYCQVCTQYINLSDMNYKAKLYCIKDKITDFICDILGFTNLEYMIIIIIILTAIIAFNGLVKDYIIETSQKIIDLLKLTS